MKNQKFIAMLPIKTEHLILRKCKLEDANLLFEMDSDAKVQLFLGGIKDTVIDDRKSYISNKLKMFSDGIASMLTLEINKSNIPIGFINFIIDEKQNSASLSYIISSFFWNQGYCTEICKKLIEIGFKELELYEIKANTVAGNIASAKVLEKIGMNKVGVWQKQESFNNDIKNIEFIDYVIINQKEE